MKKRSGEACARGAQAAETGNRDERERSARLPVSAVPGRHRAAETSPHRARWHDPISVDLRDPRFLMGGWAGFVTPLCLRAFVVAIGRVVGLCVSSVTLCLCGVAYVGSR